MPDGSRNDDETATQQLRPPIRIPGHRLLHELGAGGMGTVYLAEDELLGRRVAVKLLSPRFAGAPEAHARFLREARALAAVEHPRIVRIYSFGEAEGSPYIVMEYVEGESLGDRMQRVGKLPVGDALRFGIQTTEALDAAWQRGLVHRDVKPSNVLIDLKDEAHVVDFGLAKLAEPPDTDDITSTGLFVGTPRYVSPEQARGAPPDFRSDIYSLGIMLFEMLAGEHPFIGRTPVDLVSQHLHASLPSLREKRPEVSARIEQLIYETTAKDPARRPSSYAVIRRRLAEDLPTSQTLTPTPTADVGSGVRRRPWRHRLWLGLACTVLGAVVIGIVWKQGRGQPVSPTTQPSAEPVSVERLALSRPWSGERTLTLPARDQSAGPFTATVEVKDGGFVEVAAPRSRLGEAVVAVRIRSTLSGHWASKETNLFRGGSPSNRAISLDVHDQPVESLVYLLADAAGMPVVVDRSLPLSRVTMRMEGVAWDVALSEVLRTHGLQASFQGGAWLVTTPARAQEMEGAEDPEAWSYRSQRVPPERLGAALEAVRTETGVVTVNRRLRLVVVMDRPSAQANYVKVSSAMEARAGRFGNGGEPRGFPCSLSFLDTGIQDVFRLFAGISGDNVVVQPGIPDTRVTAALRNVAWGDALDAILRPADLHFDLRDTVLTIYPAKDDMEPIVETVVLAHERADFFQPFSRCLTQKGTLTIDGPSRTLIIKDGRRRARWFRQLAESIDNAKP